MSRPTCLVRLLLLLLAALPASLSAQDSFDKAEYAARREKLIAMIPDGVAIILAAQEHPYAVRFRQSPDFYYLTGLEEPAAVLVVNGVSKTAAVFAPKRPVVGLPPETPWLRDQENAQDRYGMPVLPLESFFTFLSFAGGNPSVKKLYLQLTPADDLQNSRGEARVFEAQALDHPLYGRQSAFAEAGERIRASQPQLAAADVSPLLDQMRWVKTPYEIERLRRSGRIAAEAVSEAIRATRPGMYEYELAAAAQYVNTRLGARGDGFPPIVPSGPMTPIVHYRENSRKMQAGEIVYMDYGSDYDYYVSDITRVWPVGGRFNPEQERMYRCVLEARNAIIAAMKPGATINTLKDVAEKVYVKYGYKEQFMQWGRYVGHFVGLSVHDVGDISGEWAAKPFEPGVVFNVEPVLEFRDKKIHVRLEDTIVITANGAENLTAAVPADLEPVYALVKQRGVNSADLVGRASK